jgi:hypothetical protein
MFHREHEAGLQTPCRERQLLGFDVGADRTRTAGFVPLRVPARHPLRRMDMRVDALQTSLNAEFPPPVPGIFAGSANSTSALLRTCVACTALVAIAVEGRAK